MDEERSRGCWEGLMDARQRTFKCVAFCESAPARVGWIRYTAAETNRLDGFGVGRSVGCRVAFSLVLMEAIRYGSVESLDMESS